MTKEEIDIALLEFRDIAYNFMKEQGYNDYPSLENHSHYDKTLYKKDESYFKFMIEISCACHKSRVDLMCDDCSGSLAHGIPYATYYLVIDNDDNNFDAESLKNILYKKLKELFNEFSNRKSREYIYEKIL